MSSDRPKWARAIYLFVSDTVLDDAYEFPIDGSEDEVHQRIEDAMNEVMCAEFGHDIMHDQCGFPGHRYCAWCGKNIAKLVRGPKDTCEGEE